MSANVEVLANEYSEKEHSRKTKAEEAFAERLINNNDDGNSNDDAVSERESFQTELSKSSATHNSSISEPNEDNNKGETGKEAEDAKEEGAPNAEDEDLEELGEVLLT